MMNLQLAAATNSCDEFAYGAAAPDPSSSLFPNMDHRRVDSSTCQRNGEHHLGHNLPLLPPSTVATHSPDDMLQFHHYLTHFNGTYYAQQQAQEYYFSAEENMASFAATQLGLNLGYNRTYFPAARGGYGHYHPPRCQAEGCKADLSGAKRYHRRHKVCEHHSKAPVVVTGAGGMHQRFCQQCSRFHLVDEFDDTKKSCRKRLADHNRRRRKSKPSDADTDASGKKIKTQAGKAASTRGKAAGSSSKSTTGGDDMVDIQQVHLGNSDMSTKDQTETMGLGEVVKEMQQVDPKGKSSMQQHHGLQQQQQQQSHHGFRQNQNQDVSSGHTSNMQAAQVVVQETISLGFHHQHSNILQLGQAMFDLDFDR